MQTPAGHSLPRQDVDLRAKSGRGLPHFARLALPLLLLWMGAAPGRCVDIFVLINGVAGESTAIGHAGWTDALSLEHGISRTPPDNAVHGTVNFTKPLDKGSLALYDLLCRGTHIADAQIEFIRSTPTTIQFYKVVLTDVFVGNVQTGITAGDSIPTENVSLHYERIAWTYTAVNLGGQPAYAATWNRINNTGTYTTTVTDTDLDGMPNAYESANGLNPNLNDANGDLDGDGLTNYQEYLAGTQPQNFNSVFRVTKINLATGQVRITWNSVAGKTYTISSASQVGGPYTPVRTVPSAGNGETYADFPASLARQFYRVAVP